MPNQTGRIDLANAACQSRRFRIPLLATMAVIGLTACQSDGPPALSLEEAKRVAASFEGESFVPPPKTITDITAILDQQKRDDAAASLAQSADADAKPPDTSDRDALAQFYHDRGKAAVRTGRMRQAIADLKKASELGGGLSNKKRVAILTRLAISETFAGRPSDGVAHFKQAIDLVENPVSRILLLGNLAGLIAGRGNLDEANRLLADAEERVAKIRNSLSPGWIRIWQRWGLFMTSRIERARGIVYTTIGRYSEGESKLRSSYRNFILAKEAIGDGFSAPRSANELTQVRIGLNLLRQRRPIEAEIAIRGALMSALRRTGRYSAIVAMLTNNLATVMRAQARPRDSEALARASLEINQRIGADPGSIQVLRARIRLASALAAQDRWKEALAEFDVMKATFNDPELAPRLIDSNPLYASVLLVNGRSADALHVAHNAATRARARLGDRHFNTAIARGILAMALTATGDLPAAIAEFGHAIPVLLHQLSFDDEETPFGRDRIAGKIMEAYIDLLARVRGSPLEKRASVDAAAVAFSVADIARGQTVQRALLASAARASAKDAKLADLARREQDALKQVGALNALYVDAVSVPTGQQDPTALDALRSRIDTLHAAREALAEEVERRFPDYAALMNPKPATIEQARAALRPGEALIATYVGRKRSYVWAVPETGGITFAAVPLGRDRMAAAVRGLRLALDPQVATLGGIPAFDTAASHDLYKALLGPVEAGWKDAKSLLVVAHGPLGQLPFSVLVTAPHRDVPAKPPLFSNYREVPFLARSHAVTVLPSVASLATLRALPPATSARRNFAGFGDPWFSQAQAIAATASSQETQVAALTSRSLIAVRGLPVHLRSAPKLDGVSSADLAKLPRLPDTADEVKSIALAMNADLKRDVFTGRSASEGRVKSMALSGYKVVAFATHGLVPGDLDGLSQPALALSSPKVVGGADDGLLTMGEILSVKLDADWVVLSACNTASGHGAGAEAVSGLGRAFFYAGTRALLASNWPVETSSARVLTTDIFKRQAKDASLSRSEALRQSMLSLIDKGGLIDAKGNMVFSYAHPIFWAPFSLVGDGGGGKPAG